jgi:hypothetical protein
VEIRTRKGHEETSKKGCKKMKECRGDMFAYVGRMKFRLFITTNGFIKNDGTAVMGAGNAKQAVKLFAEENINLPDLLGKSLKVKGNHVTKLTPQLYTFPVKKFWFNCASRTLIKRSIEELKQIIKEDGESNVQRTEKLVYILPRPGCGNGGLKWTKVKPFLKSLPDNVWVICEWNDPQWRD